MPGVKKIDIDPRSLLHMTSKNPNVMDPNKFEALVNSIRTDGFLQPVLLIVGDGGYYIVDGVHRTKAAIEVGLSKISAVVAPDMARAKILRIALNNLRGELDISEVSRQLAVMLEEGFSQKDLELTGFPAWDIEAMLETMTYDEDDALTGAVTSPLQPERTKTFNLTLKFDSESERASVREFFEALGDGSLSKGLKVAMSKTYDK